MDAVMLYSTWPDADSATKCARDLIGRRVAACANVLAGAVSVFRWEGEIQCAGEVVMIVKTSSAQAGASRDMMIAAHPYDTPCVTAVRLDAFNSNRDFMAWVERETK
jgi:periplasmic divalent cation tolerance protein